MLRESKNYSFSTGRRKKFKNYRDLLLPPINIVQMLNIFSELVFAETLPKPTLVKLEQVKYKAVMYASPYDMSSTLIFNLSAKVCNHPATEIVKKNNIIHRNDSKTRRTQTLKNYLNPNLYYIWIVLFLLSHTKYKLTNEQR